MTALFSRIFRRDRKANAPDSPEAFAARFHRFKLFLSAYLESYSEIMNFEERLAAEAPIGMPFLRMRTAKLTVSAMQCVLQLNTLRGPGRSEPLDEAFAALRSDVQNILAKGASPLQGPLAIPYDAVDESHAAIVSPVLVKLRAIRELHPEFFPHGFVVTGAGWWRYYDNAEMRDEIDRIFMISQDDPGSYSEAGATIRERLASSFPLPESLEKAVRDMLHPHADKLVRAGSSLLLRCLPVRSEHSALVMPEQVLHTPADAETVLDAVRYSLATVYRTRSIIYRLKRGIRDRAMPLCISVTFIPRVHGRGSAHRKLETLNPEELRLHVRRGFTAPETWPTQASVEGAFLPEAVQASVEQCCREALASLADAPVRGNRHEIFWVASEDGRCYVHGVNALPDPAGGRDTAKEEPLPVAFTLEGGLSTYPGKAVGKAVPVRNFTDALLFPAGGVLVLQQAAPRWSFLLDFAAAAVAGDGTGNGLFARTARRYGRPTILRQPEAFARIRNGQPLRISAGSDYPPRITAFADASALEEPHAGMTAHGEKNSPAAEPGPAGAAWPLEFSGPTPPVWLPSSDIADMARELAPRIASLTLPDSDSVDFRAENCKTFHDILNYCHVRAVREMYRSGSSATTAPAKQLVCEVPKQFWIINLDDGFSGKIKGPVVRLEEIASLPMLSFWEGFSDKPWEGPPQLNARGFLSVLFEATANPELDPASQSTRYTEKNIFLIARRFCSMRCRFGFHFLSMDCLLGERKRERFIVFQFKGGAANMARRVRRVRFVSELLAQFDFAAEIIGDTLTARLEQGTEEAFLSALRVLGYLAMHTRQLDMIMEDEHALAENRRTMLKDMKALAGRPSRTGTARCPA